MANEVKRRKRGLKPKSKEVKAPGTGVQQTVQKPEKRLEKDITPKKKALPKPQEKLPKPEPKKLPAPEKKQSRWGKLKDVAKKVGGKAFKFGRVTNPVGAALTVGGAAISAVADMANRDKKTRKEVEAAKPAKPKADKKPTPKPKPKADNKPTLKVDNKPVRMDKNGYPIYKKKSEQAGDFRKAFRDARKAGKKEFTWQGRKYNTKLK